MLISLLSGSVSLFSRLQPSSTSFVFTQPWERNQGKTLSTQCAFMRNESALMVILTPLSMAGYHSFIRTRGYPVPHLVPFLSGQCEPCSSTLPLLVRGGRPWTQLWLRFQTAAASVIGYCSLNHFCLSRFLRKVSNSTRFSRPFSNIKMSTLFCHPISTFPVQVVRFPLIPNPSHFFLLHLSFYFLTLAILIILLLILLINFIKLFHLCSVYLKNLLT